MTCACERQLTSLLLPLMTSAQKQLWVRSVPLSQSLQRHDSPWLWRVFQIPGIDVGGAAAGRMGLGRGLGDDD